MDSNTTLRHYLNEFMQQEARNEASVKEAKAKYGNSMICIRGYYVTEELLKNERFSATFKRVCTWANGDEGFVLRDERKESNASANETT